MKKAGSWVVQHKLIELLTDVTHAPAASDEAGGQKGKGHKGNGTPWGAV